MSSKNPSQKSKDDAQGRMSTREIIEAMAMTFGLFVENFNIAIRKLDIIMRMIWMHSGVHPQKAIDSINKEIEEQIQQQQAEQKQQAAESQLDAERQRRLKEMTKK